jgi:hypothetical protein
MYIFVVMFTPTTASPEAHFGIVIMGAEVDMLLCAELGCMLTRNMLKPISRPVVRDFKLSS